MIAQVAPLISMSNATDLNYWVTLGPKAAVFTVIIGAVLFAVYRGKIKFVVVGRNEKGARELFGVPVWPVFRAAHLHIDGVFAVRKAPVVPVPIELRQNILIGRKIKMEFVGTAFVKVSPEWKDLKQAIYSTLDTDKKDLENEMRDKQSRSIILGGSRKILTDQWDVDVLSLDSLNVLCAGDLLSELGSLLVKLVPEEYTFAGFHVTPMGDGQADAELSEEQRNAAAVAIASGHGHRALEIVKGGSAEADAL